MINFRGPGLPEHPRPPEHPAEEPPVTIAQDRRGDRLMGGEVVPDERRAARRRLVAKIIGFGGSK